MERVREVMGWKQREPSSGRLPRRGRGHQYMDGHGGLNRTLRGARRELSFGKRVDRDVAHVIILANLVLDTLKSSGPNLLNWGGQTPRPRLFE
jgi:hypothetical protein